MKMLFSVASHRLSMSGLMRASSWIPMTMRSGLPAAPWMAARADDRVWRRLCWSCPSVSATTHCWFPGGDGVKLSTQLASASQKAVPPPAEEKAASVIARSLERAPAPTSWRPKRVRSSCENVSRDIWSSSSMYWSKILSRFSCAFWMRLPPMLPLVSTQKTTDFSPPQAAPRSCKTASPSAFARATCSLRTLEMRSCGELREGATLPSSSQSPTTRLASSGSASAVRAAR
mmetsp:Transcript_124296/g.351876  ORF Transcript_124296/g.351876 Transcript_124296/m.351876 type:complete len:231 (-) Transcript_124296:346-1038(-)